MVVLLCTYINNGNDTSAQIVTLAKITPCHAILSGIFIFDTNNI